MKYFRNKHANKRASEFVKNYMSKNKQYNIEVQ